MAINVKKIKKFGREIIILINKKKITEWPNKKARPTFSTVRLKSGPRFQRMLPRVKIAKNGCVGSKTAMRLLILLKKAVIRRASSLSTSQKKGLMTTL
jgi:hypothetical protein